MNKLEYILIVILAATFLNQILTDFFFREGIILDTKNDISAQEKYENCLKTNPNYTKAMFNVAYTYVKTPRKKGLKKALDLLRKIGKIDYYYERLHYRQATIYCELGEWDKAIKEFNVALEQRKKDSDIYYDLGRVYYWGKKDYEKAEFYFREAQKYGAAFKDIENYLKNIKKIKRK